MKIKVTKVESLQLTGLPCDIAPEWMRYCTS